MAPLASVRRRLIVGGTALVVLLAGTLLKPAAPAAPPPAEVPAPMLRQVVEQREAETVFRRMRDRWPEVAPFTARITAPVDPALVGPVDPAFVAGRFGVVASPRHVLADAGELEPEARVAVTLANGRAFEARVAARFPERSLVLLEAPDGVTLDVPRRATAITAGSVAFAAARRADGDVIAPIFIAHVSPRELLTTNALAAFRGMPVFTLDGTIAGILSYEGDEVRLLTLDAAMQAPSDVRATTEP